jgi:hypothetical protein
VVFYQDKNIKLALVASALAVILSGCGGDDSSGVSPSSPTPNTTQSNTASEVAALNTRMDAISYNVATISDTSLCNNAVSSNYRISTDHFNIVTETGYEVSQTNAIRAAQMAEIVWQDMIATDMFDIDAANDTTITSEKWTVCLKTASDSGFKGSALDYNELEVGYTATVATDYVLMLHEMTHVLGENISYLNAVDNGQTYTINFSTMRWIKEAIATIAAEQAKIYNSEIESTFYSATGSSVVSPALINSYNDSVNAGFSSGSYDGYDEYYYYATMLQAIQDQGTNFALKDWLYLYGDYDVLTDTTALETRFNTLLNNKGITSFTLADLQSAVGFQTYVVDYIAAHYDKTVSFSADRTYTDFFIETDSIYQPSIEAVASSSDSSKILYTTKNISDGNYKIYAGTSSGDYYGPANITISGGAISGPLDLNSLPAFVD